MKNLLISILSGYALTCCIFAVVAYSTSSDSYYTSTTSVWKILEHDRENEEQNFHWGEVTYNKEFQEKVRLELFGNKRALEPLHYRLETMINRSASDGSHLYLIFQSIDRVDEEVIEDYVSKVTPLVVDRIAQYGVNAVPRNGHHIEYKSSVFWENLYLIPLWSLLSIPPLALTASIRKRSNKSGDGQ